MTTMGLVVALLFVAGIWLTHALTRSATGDPVAVRIAVGGYLVRAALALGLYAVSLWHLPVLGPVQLGGGFWLFAPDASYFDAYARGAAAAIAGRIALPYVYGSPEFPLLVTGVYALVGAHPLLIVWLNLLFATLTVILGYRVTRHFAPASSARTTAVLLALWPSAILWSTQLLKDTLETFLILAFIWGFIEATRRRGSRDGRAWTGHLTASIALLLALRFRHYVGLLLLGSALIVVAVQCGVDVYRRVYWPLRQAGIFVALILGATAAAAAIPVENLGKPVDPLPGLTRLAAAMASSGDVEGALWELRIAAAVRLKSVADPAALDRAARAELRELVERQGPSRDATPPAPSVPSSASSAAPVPLEGLARVLSTLGPSTLSDVRAGFQGSTAGRVDGASLVRAMPGALAVTFVSPNPWSDDGGTGATGVFRTLAMGEVAITLVLVSFAAVGAVRLWRIDWGITLFIALFSVALAAALGYAVPVIGILFRLRLAAVLPLTILAGSGPLADVASRAMRWTPFVPAPAALSR
jgi:hypothetical protein